MTEVLFDCPSLNELEASGRVTLQNLPSILAGTALMTPYPERPEVILEMCAAPGGKATHLARMAADSESTVVALDKSAAKVMQIEGNRYKLRKLMLRNSSLSLQRTAFYRFQEAFLSRV